MSGYDGKYKIGDVVELRDDLVVNEDYGGNCFIDSMEGYVGKPLEIIDKATFGYDIKIRDEICDCQITDEMIKGLWQRNRKYKIGDVIRLKEHLEGGSHYGGLFFASEMEAMIGIPIKILDFNHDIPDNYEVRDEEGEFWNINDAMIEGYWNKKNIAQTIFESLNNNDNFPKAPLRLIDVLNKIANGELKEGTKVVWSIFEYTYNFEKGWLERKGNDEMVDILEDICLEDLTAECELKEPTDNTKIEELKQIDMDFAEIDFASHEEYARCAIQVLSRKMIKQIDKLNEVIRCINKEKENEN